MLLHFRIKLIISSDINEIISKETYFLKKRGTNIDLCGKVNDDECFDFSNCIEEV